VYNRHQPSDKLICPLVASEPHHVYNHSQKKFDVYLRNKTHVVTNLPGESSRLRCFQRLLQNPFCKQSIKHLCFKAI